MSQKKSVKAAPPANHFALLVVSDSDSETEKEVKQEQEQITTTDPPFRTWERDEKDTRFEEIQHNKHGKNIFSSPFTKQKRPHGGRRVYKEDKDGWTSIQWNKPQFINDDDTEAEVAKVMEAIAEGVYDTVVAPPVSKEDEELAAKAKVPDQAFPSLLHRNPIVLENTIPTTNMDVNSENVQALMWAERIKKSLEKAEKSRIMTSAKAAAAAREEFEKDLGRLSFFRRPVLE